MNTRLLDQIVCPECRSSNFTLIEFDTADGDVKEGQLKCEKCPQWYRVENGVLDLLPLSLRRWDLYSNFAKKHNLPVTVLESQGHAQKLGQIAFFKEQLEAYEKNVVESSFYKALDSVSFESWAQKNLTPNDLVLSLCCGEARQCLYLATQNIHSIGIDICEEMLVLGKAKIDKSGQSKFVDLIVADAETPPFKENIFRAGILLGALHHIPRPELAIKSTAKLLTSGGLLYSMDPHDSPVRFIFDFMMKIWKLYDEEANDEPLISENKLKGWLKAGGFRPRTILSTYLPPHFLYPLSVSINKILIVLSDKIFSHIPGLRKFGGVIFADSEKLT